MSSTPSSSTVASKAANQMLVLSERSEKNVPDDDIKDSDDTVNNSHNDSADGIDDCHDTTANGLENRLDLSDPISLIRKASVTNTYTRYNGTHYD
jgi:hypothetical protein